MINLKTVDAFFRIHWIGILLVAIVTGVLGNFAYDYLKPKDPVPSTAQVAVDPQRLAQAMRTSASSLRSIAANHMRSPPPAKWQEAEHLYKGGMDQYANADFQSAYRSFNAAYRIYNDLYEQALFEGH